ncbi:hypothetical protein C5612_21290 [Pseudomonas frederiksbergensis]|uniref:Uncharacterized protein n=1 Tax=Pseudomonas frederiksbergensis TaxID=104087 RepID=A0A2S8HFX9_9PSED|nr:hypothetical protein C5612_21290 [Pseudomonas frederiksbergensis]
MGAWLAREEGTAVFQVLRVIVLRGQATLPQVLRRPAPHKSIQIHPSQLEKRHEQNRNHRCHRSCR